MIATDQEYEHKRNQMVRHQLQKRGITDDRVLAAFNSIPRHLFVPASERDHAYEDRPLPIGSGQTISQPYMVAIMTAHLLLTGTEKVLEIGTGSGYQTAILALLARQIFTVERLEALGQQARQNLTAVGNQKKIYFCLGDGSLGWPEHAPYDRIIVTAGAPAVPNALKQQLADKGKLVIPVGDRLYQKLMIISRCSDVFLETESEGCVFVPLVGREGW